MVNKIFKFIEAEPDEYVNTYVNRGFEESQKEENIALTILLYFNNRPMEITRDYLDKFGINNPIPYKVMDGSLEGPLVHYDPFLAALTWLQDDTDPHRFTFCKASEKIELSDFSVSSITETLSKLGTIKDPMYRKAYDACVESGRITEFNIIDLEDRCSRLMQFYNNKSP